MGTPKYNSLAVLFNTTNCLYSLPARKIAPSEEAPEGVLYSNSTAAGRDCRTASTLSTARNLLATSTGSAHHVQYGDICTYRIPYHLTILYRKIAHDRTCLPPEISTSFGHWISRKSSTGSLLISAQIYSPYTLRVHVGR